MAKQCVTLLGRHAPLMLALLSLFWVTSKAGAQTNSNVVLSWDITYYGAPGYTGFGNPPYPTNSNGLLTNSFNFANNNTVTFSNTVSNSTIGISDTAMTIYAFGSKSTANTKGFITYQNTLTAGTSGQPTSIPQAPTTNNLLIAASENSLITWSVTVQTGYTLVLTNATGFLDNGGSGNAASNWGFIWSTNSNLNAVTSSNVIGIGSVANAATTAMAPLFAASITNANSHLTLNGGTTYYVGLAYWGSGGSASANIILASATNDFALLGYETILASQTLQWAGNSGNWNSGNWLDTNGNPQAWNGSANYSALLTNAFTNGNVFAISLSGDVTASTVTVSNTSGLITLGGGNLNAAQFITAGTGTVQLLQSNIFPTNMPVFANGGTIDIQSNSQVIGDLSLGGGTITGSGTITPTSLSTVSGQIVSPLTGSYGLSQVGAGTTELDATNAFTGNVLVSAGVLRIGSPYALGSGSIVSVTATNASLDLFGQSAALQSLVVGFSGNATNPGALNNSSSNQATWKGPITNSSSGGAFFITAGMLSDYSQPYAGNLNISGNIYSTNKSTTVMSKYGQGTVVLSGIDQISVLNIVDGTISVTSTNSLWSKGILAGGSSSTNTGALDLTTPGNYTMSGLQFATQTRITSSGGASTLTFTLLNQSNNPTNTFMSGSANRTLNTDSNTTVLFPFIANSTNSANVNVPTNGGIDLGIGSTGSRNLQFNNNGPVIINVPIFDSTALTYPNAFVGLAKIGGTGTLSLNNTNSFNGGVSVTAGTIQIGNSNALGSGTVTMGTNTAGNAYTPYGVGIFDLNNFQTGPGGITNTFELHDQHFGRHARNQRQ